MVMTTVGIDCDALIREMPCHDVKLEDVGEREWKTVNVDHRRCYKLKREKERERESQNQIPMGLFSTIDWQRPISISIETESE